MSVLTRTTEILPGFSRWPATPVQATLLGCALTLVVGMIYSPFLLSMSMWGFVVCAVWHSLLANAGISSGQVFVIMCCNFWQQPVYAAFGLVFFISLLSGLWSTDLVWWEDRTRVRLPFLVLPWAFANLPVLERQHYRVVLYLLVWMLAITCIGVGINFLLHFEAVLVELRNGGIVPVPRGNHIRFSLIVAFGVAAGGKLFLEGFVLHWRWERWAMGVATLFLFAFIHVLSVRSGIVAVYTALIFTVLRFLYRTRRWMPGLIALAVLAAVPVLALKTLPSLQERISYMLWDWQQYNSNEGVDYSDSARFVSLESGILLWQEHPLIGVGMGDLPTETARITQAHHPKYNKDPKMPHNQFIYMLAATGIIGALLSVFALYLPLYYDRYRRHYLFAVLQVIITVSFLVEYTIETAIGVAFYLFYTLWLMQMAEAERGVSSEA
jgi:O-antigen ligase